MSATLLSLTRRLFPAARQLRVYSTALPPLEDREKSIHAKLTEKFSPSQLDVQDVSGARLSFLLSTYSYFTTVGGCGDFYAIVIASEAFKGLSTLKQHKLVTETLKKEIDGIHGLQVRLILSILYLYFIFL